MPSNPSNEGGFKQDVSRLGEGVSTLKHDVGNLADTAADAARSGAAELRQTAGHAVAAAKEKIEIARETAHDAADSLKGVIKRHPVAAVAVVAGVGVLLGMFMARSRN